MDQYEMFALERDIERHRAAVDEHEAMARLHKRAIGHIECTMRSLIKWDEEHAKEPA
jgi:hypothetical protein